MPRQTIHDPLVYLALARITKDHNINISQSQISASLICPQRTVSSGVAKAKKTLADEDDANHDPSVATDKTNDAKSPKKARKLNPSLMDGPNGQKQTKRKACDATDEQNDENSENVTTPKLKKARAGKSGPEHKPVVKLEPVEEDNGVVEAEAEAEGV